MSWKFLWIFLQKVEDLPAMFDGIFIDLMQQLDSKNP